MNFAAVIFVVVGQGDIIDAQASALCLVVCNNPGLALGMYGSLSGWLSTLFL